MMKKLKSKLSWARNSLLALGLLAGGTSIVGGQQLEAHLRLNGSQTREAFEPLRAILQQSSAVIYDGWKSISFGVVISSDGYILTKASEVEEAKALNVRIDKTHFKSVSVVASTIEWDVALLKVDGKDLVTVDWAKGEPAHGTWVVANGSTSRMRRRVRVGIISANAREVGGGKAPVVLGVTLKTNKEDEEEDVLSIGKVQDGSGAADAGLKPGDIILSADGSEISKIEDLQEVLSEKEPGDHVNLRVKRDDDEKDFEVELRAREKIFEEEKTRNDAMSGRYSKRRSNFKRIIQHDVALSERSAGGPLLNLNGECVGMNIARVNRCETFAIPAGEIPQIIEELMPEPKVE